MQYFSVVTVFYCEADLSKVVQDFFFSEWVSFLTPRANHIRQLSAISIFHNQVETKVLVSEDILELNDIRMIQCSQKICLLTSALSIVVAQRSEIDFLDDPKLVSLP